MPSARRRRFRREDELAVLLAQLHGEISGQRAQPFFGRVGQHCAGEMQALDRLVLDHHRNARVAVEIGDHRFERLGGVFEPALAPGERDGGIDRFDHRILALAVPDELSARVDAHRMLGLARIAAVGLVHVHLALGHRHHHAVARAAHIERRADRAHAHMPRGDDERARLVRRDREIRLAAVQFERALPLGVVDRDDRLRAKLHARSVRQLRGLQRLRRTHDHLIGQRTLARRPAKVNRRDDERRRRQREAEHAAAQTAAAAFGTARCAPARGVRLRFDARTLGRFVAENLVRRQAVHQPEQLLRALERELIARIGLAPLQPGGDVRVLHRLLAQQQDPLRCHVHALDIFEFLRGAFRIHSVMIRSIASSAVTPSRRNWQYTRVRRR